MVDREAIRANAKYLRGVRPLDPEEIHEYVEGRPHPSVVRRVLRESAVDLAIREREDGTFVPVDDDPVPARDWAPTAFPARHERAVLDLLVERLGRDWHRGETGDDLRARLRDLKDAYHRGRPVTYDDRTALAYACYHLPGYWAVTGYVLDRIARADLLPRVLRVVDVGAGVGGPALGVLDYLPDDAVVEYHAVEPSPAVDVFDRLVGDRRNVRTVVHRTTAEAVEFPDECDLALFANVCSELDDPAAVVDRAVDALAPDGSCLAIAPADRHTATGLRDTERAVVERRDDATVFDPTLRLWPDAEPRDDCWSFDVGEPVDPPAFQRKLDGPAGGDGTFTNPGVRFAYLVLRRDGRRRVDVRADPDRHARLADSDAHVTKRVDLLVVKLSHDLTDDAGANPLFLVGDGSQSVDHYAVLARESELNRTLREAPYAAVLAVENALVLWNDDEGAYNLVVDGEAVVDRVA